MTNATLWIITENTVDQCSTLPFALSAVTIVFSFIPAQYSMTGINILLHTPVLPAPDVTPSSLCFCLKFFKQLFVSNAWIPLKAKLSHSYVAVGQMRVASRIIVPCDLVEFLQYVWTIWQYAMALVFILYWRFLTQINYWYLYGIYLKNMLYKWTRAGIYKNIKSI